MRIKHLKSKFIISNEHAFVPAILALARAASLSDPNGVAPPQRRDVRELWRHLRAPHKRLLETIASYPAGIGQADLLKQLDLSWGELRGVHNGLARICDGVGIEKPIRTTGYNSSNRTYLMDAPVATTVSKLAKKDRG